MPTKGWFEHRPQLPPRLSEAELGRLLKRRGEIPGKARLAVRGE